MNPDEQAILDLPPIPAAELVGKLLAIRGWSKSDPEVKVPLATFHLRSGRDLAGWVLAQASSPHAEALTVQLADSGSRAQGWSVTYLSIGQIEAVTIHDARSVAHLLSDGKIPAPEIPGAEPPPTRLQLKRKLEVLAGQLQPKLGPGAKLEVSWEGIPESAEPLRALDRLLHDSAAVLEALAADELGRQALGGLQQIRFENGPSPAVQRDGQTLVIVANLKAGPAGRFVPDRLRKAVEKAL